MTQETHREADHSWPALRHHLKYEPEQDILRAAAPSLTLASASQHNINTSSRAGCIRVSLHAYNSSDDIRALAQALASVSPH